MVEPDDGPATYRSGTFTNNSPVSFVDDCSISRLRLAGPSATFRLGSNVDPWQGQ